MKQSDFKIAGLLLITLLLLLLIVLTVAVLPEKFQQPNRFEAFLALLRLLFAAGWFIYCTWKLTQLLKPKKTSAD